MRRWLLVRHGESVWNPEKRIQGQTDVPLSDKGRWQARALAQVLTKEAPVVCYSSPLIRALETARLLVAHLPSQVPLVVLQELKERRFGAWEGRTVEEVAASDPVGWRRWIESDQTIVPPSAERMDQFWTRAMRAVERIRGEVRSGSVLVSSHGGILKCIVCQLMELPPESASRMSMGNGSLTVIEEKDEQAVCVTYNERCHLQEHALPQKDGVSGQEGR